MLAQGPQVQFLRLRFVTLLYCKRARKYHRTFYPQMQLLFFKLNSIEVSLCRISSFSSDESCLDSTSCLPGQTCQERKCVRRAGGKCKKHFQCPRGEICGEDGICATRACKVDRDCGGEDDRLMCRPDTGVCTGRLNSALPCNLQRMFLLSCF